jgi:hypothetical protein
MSKLIIESIQDAQFIAEGTGPGKNYYLQGTFLQSEIPNRNGRKYSKQLLEREVNRYTNNYVVKNRALGELGHPSGPAINLDRVSHMIVELHQEGNNFIGKAKILDTPYGKIVKNFIDEGVSLGVSSRGVGSLKPANGYQLVGDDFMLATAADIVADPSAPDAFVRGIMEGKEWVMNAGEWKEVDYEQTKKALMEANRRDFEEKAIIAFKNFISKLTDL